jgi:uncharacterized membrane-anchored protein
MRNLLFWFGALAVFGVANWSVWEYERLLAHGEPVYLELVPRDPRSILQGDYMALNFKLLRDLPGVARERGDGLLVVALDGRGVATFRRIYVPGTPRAPDERLLRYRVRHDQVRLATDAFFFQEGQAPLYQGARYGEFRLGPEGEHLLTGLRDAALQPLVNFDIKEK